MPDFYGRFREGVRRGLLDETFSFVYGFDPQPLRVRITLRRATAPDRYWIVTQPVGAVAVPDAREAVRAAVGQRVSAAPVDPALCEREPIHIPGSIQPHAHLIVADAATLEVVACSANIPDALARPIGQPLAALLPDVLLASLRARVAPLIASALTLPSAPLCACARRRMPAPPTRAAARSGARRRSVSR